MLVTCPLCTRTMDFAGEPPRFCSYCGQSLTRAVAPPLSLSEAPTLAPPPNLPDTGTLDPDATLPPSAPGANLAMEDPKSIGGYRLLRRLGSGGMGTVYEAENVVSGQRVALKLIAGSYARNPEVVQRFRQEGKLASKLTHPRCVFILAAEEDQGRPYIIMELMPGPTLGDYVREKGPLPVQEAVLKILDVIDGLCEVHKLGLIHRDIKPSNCFLEASGRVKVADFGLAKSLVRTTLGESSAHLTKTGSFLGTPLYAAPEQVKGDKLDQQADLYAVAATLYFMLTGKAPFEGAGDPMATLAQIVSDDPKPPSDARPDLPPELDAVLLRALERDKKRRYRTLQEFRAALLPFTPRQQDIVGLGLRFGAFILDFLLYSALLGFLGIVIGIYATVHGKEVNKYIQQEMLWPLRIASAVIFLAYFVLLERWFGCTLGKRILRLRVCQVQHAAPPRYSQAFVRGLVFYLLAIIFDEVMMMLWWDLPVQPKGAPRADVEWWALVTGMIVLAWRIVGWIILLLPMRRRNGYRGLHEWLSGTRTIRLPGSWTPEKTTVMVRRDSLPVLQPEDAPHELGPYVVHGCHRWEEQQQILLGEESSLGRLVWIWRRPVGAAPVPAPRREVSREGRWRWLAAGADGGWVWDAFLASPGAALPIVLQRTGPMTWKQARPLLQVLSVELAEACADGTLPPELAPAQVWLQANGGVQLLDMNPQAQSPAAPTPGSTPEARALAFLRQVAILMLEGTQPRHADTGSIHAPLPEHAQHLLTRLLGGTGEPLTLAEWNRELTALMDRPAEVTRTWRIWHFTVHGAALALGLVLAEALLLPLMATSQEILATIAPILGILLFFVCCLAWSFCARGGVTLRWMGLTLCRPDGQPVRRWRCVWRTLLVGAPFVVLLALSATFAEALGEAPFTIAIVLYIALLFVSLLIRPQRGWHDAVVGTYVVPR